jgi:hypothetical protein
MTLEELRVAVQQQAALMVAVATGGPQIKLKQEEYTERRGEIRGELASRGFDDPNPFRDLWAWYGFYSQNLGRWHERRTYIREMYEPLYQELDKLAEEDIGTHLQEERTGWERVDDQVVQLRQRYSRACTVEDYQSVGLLCRDIFVSLGEAAFDPETHCSDKEEPPETLIERLSAVIEVEAPGSACKELRKLIKASLDYANKVQHDRVATRQQARLVAEATIAGVNLLRTLLVLDEELPEERDS